MHTPVLHRFKTVTSFPSFSTLAQIRKLTGYHRNAPQLLPWQHTVVTMATPVRNTTGRCDNNGRVILMRGEPRDHRSSLPNCPFCHENPFHSVWNTSMWSRDFLPLLPRFLQASTRADPEKWKERLLKWRRKILVVSFHILLQLSVFYHPSWREWSKLRCLAFLFCVVKCVEFTQLIWVIDLHLIIYFIYKNGSSKSESA